MDELITTAEVVRHFKISKTTFQRLTRSDGFPTPVRFGVRKMHWRATEIAAWLAAQ